MMTPYGRRNLFPFRYLILWKIQHEDPSFFTSMISLYQFRIVSSSKAPLRQLLWISVQTFAPRFGYWNDYGDHMHVLLVDFFIYFMDGWTRASRCSHDSFPCVRTFARIFVVCARHLSIFYDPSKGIFSRKTKQADDDDRRHLSRTATFSVVAWRRYHTH